MDTHVAPPPPDVYNALCSTRVVLDRIGDKWTALIIGVLEDGPRRFTDIRITVDGVTPKVLTQTLQGLERDGLLTRTVYAEVPPRVEYELTPLGQTLIEPIAVLRAWAMDNIEEIVEARRRYALAGT